MPWLILVAAGLLEIVWATALKQSDGFTRLWPSVIGIGGAALSFVLLAGGLRDPHAGTRYAVGGGIGAGGGGVVGVGVVGEGGRAGRPLFFFFFGVRIIGG